MKKQLIRNGVFETNSSSCHSISIDKNKEFVFDFSLKPDEDGKVHLEMGEYGWEWFKDNDAYSKACYAATAFADNKTNLNLLVSVIKEMTECEAVVIDDGGRDEYGFSNAYIDHNSYGIIPTDSKQLINFIFNKNSWLFGGNDNVDEDAYDYTVPEFRNK